MKAINRDGKRKREMRNLIRRGRVWYFKKMVDGRRQPVSLATEDLELAKAKRNAMEQAALANEWEKIQGPRTKAGTLKDVLDEYDKVGGLKHVTMRTNKSCLLSLVRGGLGQPDLAAESIRLDVLTKRLVRDYQDALRREYEEAAGTDEKARRIARDRADRTSKSTFRQGSSVFCIRRQLIERYREAGIEIPDCVLEFRSAGAVGKMASKIYFPPTDNVLRETFERIEELRESECAELEEAYYLFWAALATGCRRNELADMKLADLMELNGRLWVGAGLGKDGEQIRIPVINWPVHVAAARTPEVVMRELMARALDARGQGGYLFAGERTERQENMPDRLNAWLSRMGWKDEKKLHALRAFIGGKVFATQPRLAQLYLRHKSIATTEKFYSHFLALHGAFDFQPMVPSAPALAVLPAA